MTDSRVWPSSRSYFLVRIAGSSLFAAVGLLVAQRIVIVIFSLLSLFLVVALVRRPRIELVGETFTLIGARSIGRTTFDVSEVARVERIDSVTAATLNPLVPEWQHVPHVVRFHFEGGRTVDYRDGFEGNTEAAVAQEITAIINGGEPVTSALT